MQYRTIKKTGIKISEISLGAEHIEKAPFDKVKTIIDMAMDNGVNYTDLFMGSPDIRDHFGKALKGKRDKMMIAGHLGAVRKNNQYHRTRDMKLVKDFFWDLLKRIDTDYIDMLMLHFIDEMDDLDVCINGGMLDFALELKKKGVARMIGISTHVPDVARGAMTTNQMDAIMFSINPLFDLMPSEKGIYKLFKDKDTIKKTVSLNNDRHNLYAECQKQDVALIVMKALFAGRLLKKDSPIQMTLNQCISYALSQPSVVSACLGCKKPKEFAQSLEYVNATDEQKDFAQIYKDSLSWSDEAKCMYCNHCLPCPQEIDIADAMRNIDAGSAPPDNCISCGLCEERCPFDVKIMDIFNP
ncbi:MAG: aldo/keto reductase [Clostridiales bacterium]|nr:aldo/keto reductase [Clostridiales bacterium]